MMWVAGALVAVVVVWELLRVRRVEREDVAESARSFQNHRVRMVHASAGNKWYPHVMADGHVRWYPVAHDYALDI